MPLSDYGSHTPPDDPAEASAEERAWIEQAQAGNGDAFGKLVDAYGARVLTHLYRLTRSRADAEDLTQETFLRAYRYLNRLDAARPFKNWIYRVATNIGLNAIRSKRRRGEVVSLDSYDGEPVGNNMFVSTVETGSEQAERSELRHALGAALEHLPRRAAALVHLHYYEGMTIGEASDIVGLSENAGKVALHRARRQLREWLATDADNFL